MPLVKCSTWTNMKTNVSGSISCWYRVDIRPSWTHFNISQRSQPWHWHQGWDKPARCQCLSSPVRRARHISSPFPNTNCGYQYTKMSKPRSDFETIRNLPGQQKFLASTKTQRQTVDTTWYNHHLLISPGTAATSHRACTPPPKLPAMQPSWSLHRPELSGWSCPTAGATFRTSAMIVHLHLWHLPPLHHHHHCCHWCHCACYSAGVGNRKPLVGLWNRIYYNVYETIVFLSLERKQPGTHILIFECWCSRAWPHAACRGFTTWLGLKYCSTVRCFRNGR